MTKQKSSIVLCQHCKCSFKIYACHIRKGNGKFCSRACYMASRVKQVRVKCAHCNKQFTVPPYRLAKAYSGHVFCNRTCAQAAHRNGGVLYHRPSRGLISNAQRQIAKLSANPACCTCEENIRYLLCVHHIDGDHNNNHISNLEIVCHHCHIMRHLQATANGWTFCTWALTPRELLVQLYQERVLSRNCTERTAATRQTELAKT